MKRKRILYLMHVDWDWIKQRPHFLAEGLAKENDLLVLYRPSKSHRKLPKNPTSLHKFPLVPIPRRLNKHLRTLDDLVNLVWVSIIRLIYKPDIIWVTYPGLYRYLAGRRPKMIYDCMDDALSFSDNPIENGMLALNERLLVSKAQYVICSSGHLADVVKERYPHSKPAIIRNAISKSFLYQNTTCGADSQNLKHKKLLNIAYVGTIAEWMDYESLEFVLRRLENVKVHFIGPMDSSSRLNNEGFVYHGPKPHGELASIIGGFDGLIMPFRREPLIESVDPVKLYEYLKFDIPVISIWYPEIERFSPYVHFYKDKNGLLEIVTALRGNSLQTKSSPDEIRAFLLNNTWDNRVSDLQVMIDD